jgi:hypothetical protein
MGPPVFQIVCFTVLCPVPDKLTCPSHLRIPTSSARMCQMLACAHLILPSLCQLQLTFG